MSNGDDDMSGLGLSLGLGCGVAENQNQNPNRNQMNQYPQPSLKLNLMPFPSFFAQINHHRTSLNDLFQSADRNIDTRSFQRVPDMNRMPQVVECDDEAGVSSPNSTISSLSGKRSEREQVGGCEEAEAERTSCSQGGSDDEYGGGAGDGDGDVSRKKLRLSKEQSILLEETFKEHNTLNPKQKLALAKQLNLRPRQVEVWFQNRRARTKLKQTEVDCEYLKRCCENLTQENRRLQKEVQELRALKLSPQLYMHMNPPTTLTMCPSCERVAVASSSTSGAAAAASNRHPVNPQPQRPMPIKAWAALPINQHRSIDSPASRS